MTFAYCTSNQTPKWPLDRFPELLWWIFESNMVGSLALLCFTKVYNNSIFSSLIASDLLSLLMVQGLMIIHLLKNREERAVL